MKKIYVGNLPWSVDDDSLANIFEPYGSVASAKVISDRDTGRSRGFGFVEMSDDDGAKGWHDMMEKDVALEEVIKAKRSLLEMHLVLQPSPPDIPPPI